MIMKKSKQQNKKKKNEIKFISTKFYFINQGKCLTMTVTAPDSVTKQQLKQIFDENFVGKGSSIKYDPTVFSRFQGTYTVS